MEKNIVIMPGDGIGSEVMDVTIKILKKLEKKYSHKFNLEYLDIGGASIDKYGVPLTDEVIEKCKKSDGVLLGAVGGCQWDYLDTEHRPEQGLLKLRKEMNLYAGIRSVRIYKDLRHTSPLKESLLKEEINFILIRELVGDIFFGGYENVLVDGDREVRDIMKYREDEVRRIGKFAFNFAKRLNLPLTLVDKSDVLHTSKLWREVITELSKDYPSVKFDAMYFSNASMQMMTDPSQFGIILTTNLFGHILAEQASIISGSIGMGPSGSFSDDPSLGLYEPIHGPAQDIAGKDIANPIGCIVSLAMMFKYSYNAMNEYNDIINAIYKTLGDGYRTFDIMPKYGILSSLFKEVKCSEMGSIVLSNIAE